MKEYEIDEHRHQIIVSIKNKNEIDDREEKRKREKKLTISPSWTSLSKDIHERFTYFLFSLILPNLLLIITLSHSIYIRVIFFIQAHSLLTENSNIHKLKTKFKVIV